MPFTSIVSILRSAVITGSDIFDRYQRWKLLGKDVDAKLRLLYLECRRNLSFIDCIILKNESGVFINDRELLKSIKLLDVDVLEMIFMEGEKSHHLFEALSSSAAFKREDTWEKEGSTPSRNVSRKKTFIQLAMFVYMRIMELKKISELPSSTVIIKDIKYGMRLSNIKEAYITLVKILHAHPAVKKLDNIDDVPELTSDFPCVIF